MGPRAVLPPQVGGGGLPPRPSALARGLRVEGAGDHQEGPARRAGARAAVRRLPVHPGRARSSTSTARRARPAGRPRSRIGRDDWDAIANAHARIMWGMGIRPGDTVFIAAIFSLYMGSWGALAGAERLRAKAFPFGAGAPGMTARAAMWLDAMKPAAFYGTPSFALHLAEVARARRLRSARVRPEDDVLLRRAGRVGARACATASPSAYGAQVIDCGSMAEMTPFMNVAGTAETDGMLLLAGHRLHRGLRSADVPPRALRPARHARLHAPRAHVAADDPARVRRSHAVGGRAQSRAAAPIRGCRRASSAASTTCSRSAARTSTRARSTRW